MSELIGGSDTYSTWARVRSPVRGGLFPLTGFHNVEYPINQFFWKTIEGNGLLRGFTPTMDFIFTTVWEFSAINFVEPYDTKFVGETVTITGPDTFNITAAAFVPPAYQTVPTATGSNPITAIGLLTPV
jgi:hypothetical protein